jgi:hypothetical protein
MRTIFEQPSSCNRHARLLPRHAWASDQAIVQSRVCKLQIVITSPAPLELFNYLRTHVNSHLNHADTTGALYLRG